MSELSDSEGNSSTGSDDNTIIEPNHQQNSKPPLASCTLKDKLNHWLKEDPSSPLSPLQEDSIDGASTSFSNTLDTKVFLRF